MDEDRGLPCLLVAVFCALQNRLGSRKVVAICLWACQSSNVASVSAIHTVAKTTSTTAACAITNDDSESQRLFSMGGIGIGGALEHHSELKKGNGDDH